MIAAVAMLAHQGGWDEVLLPVVAVLLVIGLGVRRRKQEGAEGQADGAEGGAPAAPERADVCQYCGAALAPEDERCPSCGFARD